MAGTTLYVFASDAARDAAKGADSTKYTDANTFVGIMAAVNVASDGDTIIIAAGDYTTEDEIQINKALTVKAAEDAEVIVDHVVLGSDYNDPAVSAVTVSGLIIRPTAHNSGDWNYTGVWQNNPNIRAITIENCVIDFSNTPDDANNKSIGIKSSRGTADAVETLKITGNTIIGTDNTQSYITVGDKGSISSVTVEGNTCYGGSSSSAVTLDFSRKPTGEVSVLVKDNEVADVTNGHGINFGNVKNSDIDITVTGNTVEKVTGVDRAAINMHNTSTEAGKVTVSDNVISDSIIGVNMSAVQGVVISDNTLADCDESIIYTDGSVISGNTVDGEEMTFPAYSGSDVFVYDKIAGNNGDKVIIDGIAYVVGENVFADVNAAAAAAESAAGKLVVMEGANVTYTANQWYLLNTPTKEIETDKWSYDYVVDASETYDLQIDGTLGAYQVLLNNAETVVSSTGKLFATGEVLRVMGGSLSVEGVREANAGAPEEIFTGSWGGGTKPGADTQIKGGYMQINQGAVADFNNTVVFVNAGWMNFNDAAADFNNTYIYLGSGGSYAPIAVELQNGAEVTFADNTTVINDTEFTMNITVDATSTLTLDATSSITASTLTVADGGKFIIDATGFEGVKKVVDLAGESSLEGKVTINGEGVSAIYDEDGDVTLVKADTTTLYVNSAYAGEFGKDLGEGKYFGVNAFANLGDAAAAATDGSEIIVSGNVSGKAVFANGKKLTITGNAEVAWADGWFMIGRGAEDAVATEVTIKDAVLTSPVYAWDEAGTGFNIAQDEGEGSTQADGILNIENSKVAAAYLANRNIVNVTGDGIADGVYGYGEDGEANLIVRNGFYVSRDNDDTKVAEMNITNGAYVIVEWENSMGIGWKGRGVLNITDSKFETSCTHVATNPACLTVDAGGAVNVTNGVLSIANILTNNGTVTVAGESTLNVATLSGNTIDLMDGAIVKDSTVGGGVFVAGDVTFRGDNTFGMITDFGTLTDYYGTTAPMAWTVEAGASVTLTNTARYGLGYGDKVVVNGEIAANGAAAARATLTDDDSTNDVKQSLFMHGLVAQESAGWNCDSSFTVNNAFVTIGSNNSFGSKAGNYGGNYTFSFNNSVLNASRITFYNTNAKTTFTLTGSDVEIGQFMTRDQDSVFTLDNTKLYSTSTINGNDEGQYNAGTLNVTNGSTLTYSAEMFNEATGVINVDNATFVAPEVKNSNEFNVSGESTLDIATVTGNAIELEGTLVDSTVGGSIKVYGTEASIADSTVTTLLVGIDPAFSEDTGFFAQGYSDVEHAVTITDEFNGSFIYAGSSNEKSAKGKVVFDGADGAVGEFYIMDSGHVILQNNADVTVSNYINNGGILELLDSNLTSNGVNHYILALQPSSTSELRLTNLSYTALGLHALRIGGGEPGEAVSNAKLSLDNSTVTVSDMALANANDFEVSASITNDSKVDIKNTMTIGAGAVVTMDATSNITANNITGDQTITVDVLTEEFSGYHKLIDVSTSGGFEVAFKGYDSAEAFETATGITVIESSDGDVALAKVDESTIFVNSAWSDQNTVNAFFGTSNDPVWGGNAFADLNAANAAIQSGTKKISVISGTYEYDGSDDRVYVGKEGGIDVAFDTSGDGVVLTGNTRLVFGTPEQDVLTSGTYNITGNVTAQTGLIRFQGDDKTDVTFNVDGNITTEDGSIQFRGGNTVISKDSTITAKGTNEWAHMVVYGNVTNYGKVVVDIVKPMGAAFLVGTDDYADEFGYPYSVFTLDGKNASLISNQASSDGNSAFDITVSGQGKMVVKNGATVTTDGFMKVAAQDANAKDAEGKPYGGTVEISGSTLIVGKTLFNEGNISVTNSTFDAAVVENTGTFSIGADGEGNAAAVTFKADEVVNNGTITVTGSTFAATEVANTGTFSIGTVYDETTTKDVESINTVTIGDYTGEIILTDDAVIAEGSKITTATGTITVEDDATLYWDTVSGAAISVGDSLAFEGVEFDAQEATTIYSGAAITMGNELIINGESVVWNDSSKAAGTILVGSDIYDVSVGEGSITAEKSKDVYTEISVSNPTVTQGKGDYSFTLAAEATGGAGEYTYEYTYTVGSETFKVNGTSFTIEDPSILNAVSGKITVTVTAADQYGKSASADTVVTVTDYTDPVMTVTTLDKVNGWTNKDVTFTASATDVFSSVTVTCTYNGADVTPVDGKYSFTTDKFINGDVVFTAKDANGNTASEQSFKVQIDKLDPVLSSCDYSLKNGRIVVNYSAKDQEGASGVAKVKFYVDGQEAGESENAEGTFSFEPGNESTFYLEVIDAAGNVYKSETETVKVSGGSSAGAGESQIVQDLHIGDHFTDEELKEMEENYSILPEGESTVSVQKGFSAKAKGFGKENGTGSNNISLGKGSSLEVYENIDNLGDVSIGKYGSLTVLSQKEGAGETLSGTDDSQSVGVGKGAGLHVCGNLDLGDGHDVLSSGKYGKIEICGDLIGGAGNDSVGLGKGSGFTADSVDLGVGDDALSTGKYSAIDIAGAFEGGAGNDSVGLGKGSGFTAASVDFGAGNDALSTGKYGAIDIAGAFNGGDGSDSIGLGKGSSFAAASVDFGDGNDTFSFGKYASARIGGDLDFGAGYDTLSFGKGNTLEIAGALTGVEEINCAYGSIYSGEDFDFDNVAGNWDLLSLFHNAGEVNAGADIAGGVYRNEMDIYKAADNLTLDFSGIDNVDVDVWSDGAWRDAALTNGQLQISAGTSFSVSIDDDNAGKTKSEYEFKALA